MPHIHAQFTSHEEDEFRFWESKPIDRYELEYYSLDAPDDIETLYSASMRKLFKSFFEKTRREDVSYTLEVSSHLPSTKQNKILYKFKTEEEKYLRHILKLQKEQPLPTGAALEKALQAVANKHKAHYISFLKKQLAEVTHTTEKLHAFLGTLGLLSAAGAGILFLGTKTGTLPFHSGMPLAVLSISAITSAGVYFFISTLQKNYIKNTQKMIKEMSVPSQTKTTGAESSSSPTRTVESVTEPPKTPVAFEPDSEPNLPPPTRPGRR
jgi:hypothetical protein